MKIGVPIPTRVRPRESGSFVPRPGEVYQGMWGLHRRYVRPAVRGGRKVASALLPWGLAVLLGYFLRFIILNWPKDRVVAVCVFMLIVPIFIRWVETTIIVNIIFMSGLVAIPKPITVGGQGFKPQELMVLIGLAVAFFKFHAERPVRLPRSPLTIPLLIFMFSILLSIGLRYRDYMADPRGPFPFKDTYNAVRNLSLYMIFFVFLYGVRTEKQIRRIVYVALATSAIVGLLMVLQYFVGPSVKLFAGRVEALQEGGAVVTRAIPPGMAFLMIYFPLTVYLAARAPLRNSAFLLAIAACLGLGLIFSMTRNFWITNILGVLIVAALSQKQIGVRVIIYGFAVVAISLSLASVAGNSGLLGGNDFVGGLQTRLTSSFAVKTDQSMAFRLKENRQGWARLKKNWVFGLGAGSPARYDYEIGSRGAKVITRYGFHNSYLEFWLLYGILALGSFLWIQIAFAFRCLYVYKNALDPITKAFGVSFFASVIGVLIRSWMHGTITVEVQGILACACMWGMLESVWNLHEARKQEAEIAGKEAARQEQHYQKVAARC